MTLVKSVSTNFLIIEQAFGDESTKGNRHFLDGLEDIHDEALAR